MRKLLSISIAAVLFLSLSAQGVSGNQKRGSYENWVSSYFQKLNNSLSYGITEAEFTQIDALLDMKPPFYDGGYNLFTSRAREFISTTSSYGFDASEIRAVEGFKRALPDQYSQNDYDLWLNLYKYCQDSFSSYGVDAGEQAVLNVIKSIKPQNFNGGNGGGYNTHPGNSGSYNPYYNSSYSMAWNAGHYDGFQKGESDGKSEGLRDGQIQGRNEGDSKGKDAGYREGFSAGKKQGSLEGMELGMIQGKNEGNAKGQRDGITAGEKRCFDAGYSEGYKKGVSNGQNEASQTDSYKKGYDKGVAKAQTVEPDKGYNAGYNDGFTLKEKEIRDSFWKSQSRNEDVFISGGRSFADPSLLKLRVCATKSDADDYNNGYKTGFKKGYDKVYEKSRTQGYQETYMPAYNSAYQFHYQNGFREGSHAGKDESFKISYQQNFDKTYNEVFSFYKSKEYSEERARGEKKGFDEGKVKGFNDECTSLYNKGYEKGYQVTAQELYQPAFEKGKKAGIEKADLLYKNNAVIEFYTMTVKNSEGTGKFGPGDKIVVQVGFANYGFLDSANIICSISSSNQWAQPGKTVTGNVKARKTSMMISSDGTVSEDVIKSTAVIKASYNKTEKSVQITVGNPAHYEGKITSSYAKLYKGIGSDTGILINSFNSNDTSNKTVVVMEYSCRWYKVYHMNSKAVGWMRKAHVTTDFPIPADPQQTEKTGKITASSLSVRKGPGTNHDRIGYMKEGTSVRVLRRDYTDNPDDWYSNEWWYEVEAIEPSADGKKLKGFVSVSFVKID